MNDKLQQILNKMQKYNTEHLAAIHFGLSENILYDALIVAPTYSPQKVLTGSDCRITKTGGQMYCAGYFVEKDNLKIAWINVGTGSCNLIDYLLLFGNYHFSKLIFIGAVGALTDQFAVGDLCTPACSIAGTLANTYLKESLKAYVPFEKIYPAESYVEKIIGLAAANGCQLKKASVFCTDSITMEYSHLEEIKSFGADLIEMETAAFYAIADMMEVPSIALLIVSDNSSLGIPIVGRNEEVQKIYHHTRQVILPDLLFKIIHLQ